MYRGERVYIFGIYNTSRCNKPVRSLDVVLSGTDAMASTCVSFLNKGNFSTGLDLMLFFINVKKNCKIKGRHIRPIPLIFTVLQMRWKHKQECSPGVLIPWRLLYTHAPARLYSVRLGTSAQRSRDLHFHDNRASCLKACL